MWPGSCFGRPRHTCLWPLCCDHWIFPFREGVHLDFFPVYVQPPLTCSGDQRGVCWVKDHWFCPQAAWTCKRSRPGHSWWRSLPPRWASCPAATPSDCQVCWRTGRTCCLPAETCPLSGLWQRWSLGMGCRLLSQWCTACLGQWPAISVANLLVVVFQEVAPRNEVWVSFMHSGVCFPSYRHPWRSHQQL